MGRDPERDRSGYVSDLHHMNCHSLGLGLAGFQERLYQTEALHGIPTEEKGEGGGKGAPRNLQGNSEMGLGEQVFTLYQSR